MIKNITIILGRFSGVLIFILILSGSAFSDPSADRQLAIAKELDCVETALENDHALGWRDVCYTNTAKIPAQHVQYAQAQGSSTNSSKKAFDLWDFDTKQNYARENITSHAEKLHHFDIGAEYFWAHYEEPDVMEQRGEMWGVNGAYTYRPNQGNLLYSSMANLYRLEGMFAAGHFDYEAEAVSQVGLQVKDKDDWMYDIRGIVGKEYIPKANNSIVLYSGFGYRYLNDDDDGQLVIVGSTGFYGYEREANYYYIPIGFEFATPLNDRWSVKTKGEYDWFIQGKQVSHLSDGNVYLSPGSLNEDATNKQETGYGLRGSLQFIRDTEFLKLVLEPFVRFWAIDDSEVKTIILQGSPTAVLEPENQTLEYGFKVGLEF